MKKQIKFIVLCLSLAVLVGSVIGISAAAADNGSVEILAQNVVVGEKVAIAYAVDVSVEDAESVTLEYYLKSAPETIYKAKLLDTSVSENLYVKNEVAYPSFATFGFAAYDFTDVVCATAYVGDEKPAGAEYKEYSVGEYLYARLYKDGFIDKTDEDGEDYDRKTLYESLIAYGTAAQQVLINNKLSEGETAEILLSDYAYLTAENNMTYNGKNHVFLPIGSSTTVEYTESEAAYGYHVYSAGYSAQRLTASGATIAVYPGMTYTKALYPTYDFTEYDATLDAYGNVATPNAYTSIVHNGDKTGKYFNLSVTADPINASSNCLRAYVYSDGNYKDRGADANIIAFAVENPESTASAYVFECDIMLTCTVVNSDELIMFAYADSGNTTQSAEKPRFYRNGGTEEYNFCYNKASNIIKEAIGEFGKWINYRVEIYQIDDTTVKYRYFVNDTFIYESSQSESIDLAMVRVIFNRNKCGERYFDNVTFRKVDLEYTAIQ